MFQHFVFFLCALLTFNISLAQEPSQLSAPLSPLTLEAWDQMDQEDRAFIAEGYGAEFNNVTTLEFSLSSTDDVSALSHPLARQFAEKMHAAMQVETSLEVGDDHYAQYGPTFIFNVTLVLLDDTTILGGSLSYIQYGCIMPDESSPHFEDEDEARHAGCDVNADVSWQAHGVFNYDLEPLYLTGYMEWSGH